MATDRRAPGSADASMEQVVFKPLMATKTGAHLPVSFATLPWSYQGALGLSIIVKATFTLDGGKMRPRKADPIYVRDTARDAGALISAPSDMVPRKPQVDVVAVGRARAQAGRSRVTARVSLIQGGLVLLDRSVELNDGEVAPFGPIPAAAAERRKLLGAAPQVGEHGVLHVPANLQWAYFQSAPAGQTVDALRGDAVLVLEGMNARHPTLRTAMPGCWAVGTIFGLNSAAPDQGNELTFKPDTLVADAERLLGTIVWRAEVGLPNIAKLADLTVAAGVGLPELPLTAPTSLQAVAGRSEPPPGLGKPGLGKPGLGGPPAGLDATMALSGNVADAVDAAAAAASNVPFAESALAQGTMEAPVRLPGEKELPFDKNAGGSKQPAALAWAEKMEASAAKGATVGLSGTPNRADTPTPFINKPAGAKSSRRVAAWAGLISQSHKEATQHKRPPPPPRKGLKSASPSAPPPQPAEEELEPISLMPESIEPESIEPESIEPESIEPESIEPESIEPQLLDGPSAERLAQIAASFQGVDSTAAPRSSGSEPAPLPFEAKEGATPMPSAERWAKLVQIPDKGGTVSSVGSLKDEQALPFEENKRRAKIEQARKEREQRRAEEKAEAERRAKIEQDEHLKQQAAAADKRARDEKRAAERAAEDKRRFEESQKRLRELEAKRAEEERRKAEEEAKELEDGLYGGFG